MDDLVRWLGEQLDEDERIARRAADYDDGASHDVQGSVGTWTCLDESEWFGASYRGGVIAPRIGYANAPELGAHIVEWDPARVLREIDAKRQIVDRYVWLREHGDTGGIAWVLPLLALPYADRPGYREEWRP